MRTYVNAAGLVATLASGSGAIYSALQGGPEGFGWAITFGCYTGLSALCWRWALKIQRETEAQPPKPATVPEVDPVVADLDRAIAAARRAHKPRRHLVAAKHARIEQLLAGRA